LHLLECAIIIRVSILNLCMQSDTVEMVLMTCGVCQY